MQRTNAKPFLSLTDVSIRLHERILFEHLSWEILSDQHWAVIGPNGSGKSALMRAISGTLPIVQGSITYHFQRDTNTAHDQIAYVNFESQRRVLGHEAFYQERWNAGMAEDAVSVSEYLSAASLHHVNAFHVAETHADENYTIRSRDVIEQLELGKLLERNLVQLSNGERRKVVIARALLKNPHLLILDNPFNGLDERFRKKFSENLDNLMRGKARVILVGTSLDELPRGITHMLEMSLRGASVATKQSPRTMGEIASHKTLAMTQPQARETIPTDAGGSNTLPNLTVATRSNVHSDPPRKILVQMHNVNISYNGTPILHHVNWVVRENERWALLGPNGAGKTTLLSLILADNPQAYANDITLFGKRRGAGESIWEIKQNIGWVAPELQLYYPRNATCLDVACSGWFDSVGLYRECSVAQRAVAEKWLGEFGMSGRAHIAFEKISEGEQRLALLARALVKDPTLLVLDEPCQGLDTQNRDRVLQAIERVSERAMIYVTHRADEMPQSITHVLRLDTGKIVQG